MLSFAAEFIKTYLRAIARANHHEQIRSAAQIYFESQILNVTKGRNEKMAESQNKSTKQSMDMTDEEFKAWSRAAAQETCDALNSLSKKTANGQPSTASSSDNEKVSDRQGDSGWQESQSSSHQGLDDCHRIDLLRSQVSTLPIAEDYKSKLLHSIDIYRDQILKRPEVPVDGGWNDLEALQQVTLGDMTEDWFHKKRENDSNTTTTNRLHVSVAKQGGSSMSMQPEFVNYNVRVYSIKDEQRGWCREQKIPSRVFVNYDGSGYNFHIVEFQELEHAHAFMKHFNITGDRCLWAEDGDGDIHYLDSNQQLEGVDQNSLREIKVAAREENEDEFVILGTLIEGPDINLIKLSGLDLSDEEEDRIWDEISRRNLLVEVLECEEIEIEEMDCVPGLSDSVYEYRCGDKADFIARLREALLQYARGNAS